MASPLLPFAGYRSAEDYLNAKVRRARLAPPSAQHVAIIRREAARLAARHHRADTLGLLAMAVLLALACYFH